MPRSSQLVGVAGVHYVASYLSFIGFHAVPTTRNVQGPDLLVSNLDGSKCLSIQVKTANWAMRTRGRGEKKKLQHHCEWDIGWSSARINHPNLLFALVDLKSFSVGLPDVYIVPSSILFDHFKNGDPAEWRRARFHPLVEAISQFKNNWEILRMGLENYT